MIRGNKLQQLCAERLGITVAELLRRLSEVRKRLGLEEEDRE